MRFGQRFCFLCAIFGLFLFSIRILYGADPSAIPLKKGERIVFLGDSITQAGVNPNGYVSVIRNALDKKYQDLGIEIIGAGISGNKVADLQKRVD
ncbi:MAG TPA: hypothetical protein VGY77_00470, partial [Gemmataceae bacterium]|nr:hypothetical protein [Gemmataceae bacterium]